jgi:RING finger protein 113A
MDGPVVTFKKRSAKNIVRKAAPPPRSDSESSSGSETDDDGRVVKRRKIRDNALKASTAEQQKRSTLDLGTTKYDADRSAKIEASSDATKQSNWYEEKGDDALSSKNLLGTTRSLKPASFVEKNPDAPVRQVGPMKAATNIRTITVTDYAPDVCKDYKQTGFCGFGDNCKFLHAREDYAAGWKLDKEWEMSNKAKKPGGTIVASANRNADEKSEFDGADIAMLEKIPFACVICKGPYKSPMVTKCGHYFCESCALKRYKKDPTCAACGEKLSGSFKVAKNLQKLLDKKKRYEDKKKEDEEAAKAEEERDGN